MTRGKAIEIIEYHKILVDNDKSGLLDKDLEYEAINKAIKALEQEPVLDKIRAEIEQERIGYPPSADYYKAIMKCLQIIDKYKESEE